jgi:LmbE family N-acetylglucosaminyl deacetylase
LTTLFLFAHQDDEIGAYHAIRETITAGNRAVCAYLTDGGLSGSPHCRNAEATAALLELGVAAGDIHFIGETVAVGDGQLVEKLEVALDALRALANKFAIDEVVMHAWEGGHHDHDAVHLVGLALASELCVLSASFQFPLYRPPSGRWVLRFARTLGANGPVKRLPIPPRQRLRYLLMLRHYRSQLPVMVRLAPVLAWDYLIDGCQKLQPVSTARALERPTAETALYETWKLYTYAKFQGYALPFSQRHLRRDRCSQPNSAHVHHPPRSSGPRHNVVHEIKVKGSQN